MSVEAVEKKGITRPENLPEFIEFDRRERLSLDRRSSIGDDLIDRHGLTGEEVEVVVRYLETFSLSLESLVGKKIIDVGSGLGNFKKGLNKLGKNFDVVSFDRGMAWEGTMDVKGDALKMPFQDESFDLELAYGSTPLMYATRNEFRSIPSVIKEMLRIVRKGGVVKIFPVAIDNPGFPEGQGRYSKMASQILGVMDEIHKQNPDFKIKITEIKDGPAVRQLLEIFKPLN